MQLDVQLAGSTCGAERSDFQESAQFIEAVQQPCAVGRFVFVSAGLCLISPVISGIIGQLPEYLGKYEFACQPLAS